MLENIRLAFQGVWSHKMRSILTMLGIIIGIAAIITIVSTIKGTNEQIKENLIGAGNNVVAVQLNQNGYPFDASWNDIPSAVKPITEHTRQDLEALDGAQKVSLFYSRSYADGVFYQDTQYNGGVYGVDNHYFSAYGYQVKTGRGFTQEDYQNFRKVAILDVNAVSSLSIEGNPVGKAMEDLPTTYRLVLLAGGGVLLPKPVYHYRCRAGSITMSALSERNFHLSQNAALAYEDICNRVPELIPDAHYFWTCTLRSNIQTVEISDKEAKRKFAAQYRQCKRDLRAQTGFYLRTGDFSAKEKVELLATSVGLYNFAMAVYHLFKKPERSV